MARGKSDIANMAIRILLQKVGEHYDSIRGLSTFSPTTKQRKEVLEFFNNDCVFCGERLTAGIDWDHLIPINRTALGLHAWGNVVPSCTPCHKKKHHKNWEAFVANDALKSKILSFQKKYKYEPSLVLNVVAQSLYEDVGAVAMVLIDLRFKQAQELLKLIGPQNTKTKPLKRDK